MPYELLVMDDSVTIRRVVELTFAGGDVRVVAVGDGRAAMDRIAAQPPDVILADVGTAPPDGYEVSAFVKRNPALAHIPVLLLSGAFQPVDEERARDSGCDGVLAKPFEPAAVEARVRQLLQAPQPAANREEPADGGDLLAFLEQLLADPSNGNAAALPAALLPEPAPAAPPAAAPAAARPILPSPAAFSLDDYFDLVDEFLSRKG